MNLKMSYNSFIKLKDFFKIVDITAEVKEYQTKNDTLEGNLEIHGKYQKRDGITEDYFLENVPFSIIFKNSEFEIIDIICTDIDYVAIDGRGVDVTFDILTDYNEVSEIPVNLDENVIPVVRENDVAVEVSSDLTPTEVREVEKEEEEQEMVELDAESIDEADFEQIKEEETKRVDTLLKSTLNFKDDNLPTEEIVIRNIPETKSKIKVCYYQDDHELEKVCENNNLSINQVFKENRNRNIEKYRRVIIHESSK